MLHSFGYGFELIDRINKYYKHNHSSGEDVDILYNCKRLKRNLEITYLFDECPIDLIKEIGDYYWEVSTCVRFDDE